MTMEGRVCGCVGVWVCGRQSGMAGAGMGRALRKRCCGVGRGWWYTCYRKPVIQTRITHNVIHILISPREYTYKSGFTYKH